MAISFDKVLGPYTAALELRSQRAELIAGNIANAETPNYLARDLDFQRLLENRLGQGTLATTDAGHLQARGGNPGEPLYRVPSQPSIDGNTVDAHQEKAAFADNALRYQTSLRLISSRIQGMMSALRGE